MSRLSSAMAIALLGVALAASVSLGQQSLRRRSSGSEPDAGLVNPMAAARGARHLLRNGMDYLDYQEYERALAYFREAESRKAELTSAELKTLREGIATAQRGLQEVGNSPRRAYARSRSSAPGTVVAAKSRDRETPREEEATEDDVQLAGATTSVPAAATSPPIGRPSHRPLPRRRPARAQVQNLPDQPPVIPSALPLDLAAAPTPAPAPAPEPVAAASAPATDLATNPAEPAAASVPPADLAATPPPTAPIPLPAPRQTPLTSELANLPPLPGEAPKPGTPPEPLPLPEPTPAPLPLKPDTIASQPAASSTPGGLPALPSEPPSVAEPASELPQPTATRHSADPDAHLPGEPATALATSSAPPRSSLSPELRREVERIAQMQDEAAQRNQAGQATSSLPPGLMTEDQPMTRLELPRAPSPTEARPLRAIPVPEEFVPLAPRQWGPTRKYWAAAATCHAPLYFQDAMLERYGHSAEQFFGPRGRFLTYPLDDPTQSNQRNQIIQPFFSAGLFALQIALLPYNAIMDAPWEAEYDLGYWRPGDRIPPDLIYVPPTGVGPPLRGANY